MKPIISDEFVLFGSLLITSGIIYSIVRDCDHEHAVKDAMKLARVTLTEIKKNPLFYDGSLSTDHQP
jgi:hypothetical protein